MPTPSTMDDGDLFFELPLNRWPLFENQSLAKSKLVLRYDLVAQLDMFNAEGTGLGLRDPYSAAREIRMTPRDRKRLAALIDAGSYDVYSTRAALSTLLSDEELNAIRIPEDDQAKLQIYLNAYSRGLLAVLLDGTDIAITSRSSLASVLQGEAREQVLVNVQNIAKRLGIVPGDLVFYISRLAEMILAISYFRRVFELMIPNMQALLKFVKKLHDTQGVDMRFPGLKRDTDAVIGRGRDTMVFLKQYFRHFTRVEDFFETITPEKFQRLSIAVNVHYRAIGLLICFWQIRIDQWRRKFANVKGEARTGTLEQRYNFFKEVIDVCQDRLTEPLEHMRGAEIHI
ncbi:MAG: hypothetical protein SFV21_17410 [Rhodospirillaceae bacterium]|nr:hypothetical protein [Rhodospirillaceae bacterium]